MAEIVNLHRARKRNARVKAAAGAEANRAKFGRTLAERERDERQAARSEAKLDQHRLDKDQP